jgi:RimJ/RimL family protein N-acetyltransferase
MTLTSSQPGVAPVIETARLRLRAHRMNDLAECAAMWGDPAVTRYIGGRPFTREEVWARLLRYAGHWNWLGYGFWVLEEKATGRFAGELGFADFKRDIQASLEGAPEIGWVLATRVQGQGYATEGVRAAVAWGDTQAGWTRTACLIHPENRGSIRVAEKCGYRERDWALYKGQPAIVFDRMAE